MPTNKENKAERKTDQIKAIALDADDTPGEKEQ